MNEQEIEQALSNVRKAIKARLNADQCRRCKKGMPVEITGVYFGRQLNLNPADPNAVWQATWRPAEEGWATIEIGSARFCLCPLCTKEVLPFKAEKRKLIPGVDYPIDHPPPPLPPGLDFEL